MGTFDKLDEKFDTESFELELADVNNKIVEVKNSKNEIIDKINQKSDIGFTKEDQNYLIEQNISLMNTTNIVLEKLEKDIKIGTPVRYHEVFSQLVNSKVNILKELRELYKTIRELNIVDVKNNPTTNKTNNTENIAMTPSDFLKLIKEAEKQSSLNAIDATFEIREDER